MLSGGLPVLCAMPYYGDLGIIMIIYEVQTLSASPTSPDIEFTCFMMVQTWSVHMETKMRQIFAAFLFIEREYFI